MRLTPRSSQRGSKSKAPYRGRRTRPTPRTNRWWPLALIAAGIVVLGGVWWAAFGAGGGRVPIEVTGSPRLKADRQRVDLGDVRLGRTVEVSFQLANAGDQPLRFAEAPYVTVAEGC